MENLSLLYARQLRAQARELCTWSRRLRIRSQLLCHQSATLLRSSLQGPPRRPHAFSLTHQTMVLRRVTPRHGAPAATSRLAQPRLQHRLAMHTIQLTAVNAALRQEITEHQRTEQRLAIQDAITRILADSNTLAAATPHLLQAIGESLEWEWGAYWSIDRNAGVLRCQSIWHAPHLETTEFDTISRQIAGMPGRSLKGRVWQSAEAAWMADATQDPNFMRAPIAARVGLRGAIAFPILSRGETVAIIEFFSRTVRQPEPEQLAMLSAIGNQIGQFVERKEAEALLREANERVAMILDSITDRFFAVDHEWRYTYFNKHAEEQLQALGKHPAHFIGKVLWEVFPNPMSEAELRRAMSERVMATDEDYYPPLRLWYENRIYPSPNGGLAIFQRDITERKRADDELRRSEAYLAEGQRLSHTGSWAWNVVTGDLSWSQEHFRIFGLDPERVKPSYPMLLQWIHSEDRSFVQQTFDQAVRDISDYALDCRIVCPDGTMKHIHSVAHPVFDASGDLTEYVGTIIDTTERKRAEETAQKVQADLAHVTRVLTLGALTTSIAHEVNQPLTAVMNNANACLRWLGRATPDLEAVRGALRDIVINSQRASEVIVRIRAALKKAPTQAVPLDLNRLIVEVVELTHHEVQRRKVRLRTDLAAALPFVLGDHIQLQQVLLNLVMNGFEAMSTVVERPRDLQIRSGRTGAGGALVAVQDAGIGLDPQMLECIFDAFFTTKPAGIGMGLSISRTIIQAHGGQLWAERNPGHGATFQFILPKAGENGND